MITSKTRANCVLSIKTDKRYSVRPAAYSGASAALSVAIFCVRASCSPISFTCPTQNQTRLIVSFSKIAPLRRSLINAFAFGFFLGG
jgi:hypothetical protein